MKKLIESVMQTDCDKETQAMTPQTEKAAEWRVEYDNDTGPEDDSFIEWWIVTNGEERFTSKVRSYAVRLCSKLNEERRHR